MLIKILAEEFVLEVSGHAGWGDKGEDIVCAAVSSLVTGSAELWKNIGGVRIIRLDNKYIFKFSVEDKWEKLKNEYHFLLKHLKLLADNYPEHIEFNSEHPL